MPGGGTEQDQDIFCFSKRLAKSVNFGINARGSPTRGEGGEGKEELSALKWCYSLL